MQNSSEKILILASNSPRRRELLAEAGVRFEIHAYETDEQRLDGEAAAHLVQRLSCLKARAAETHHPKMTEIIPIACDHAGYELKLKVIEHLKQKGFPALRERRHRLPYFIP